MTRFFRDLRQLPSEVRWFFLGVLCLGIGQQIFVVVRNPWLVDLGYASHQVTPVQAAGGLAGVLVGIFAIYATRSWSPLVLFVVCGLAQSLGFVTQLIAPMQWLVPIAGGALAGFGIQLHTAITPAFLGQVSSSEVRTTIFSTWSLTLVPFGGVCGALAIGLIGGWTSTPQQTQTFALVFAAAISFCAILPWLKLKTSFARPIERKKRRWSKEMAIMLTIHALLALAGGLTIPFLQLYFKLRFGVSPFGIASIYALTMLISVIAHMLLPALVHRFGLWQTTLGLLGSAIPYFVMMALSPWLSMAVAAFLGRHVFTRTGMPMLHQLGQELMPAGDGPLLASQVVLVTSASWAIGNLLAGPLLQLGAGTFTLAFAATCAVYFVAIVLGLFFLPSMRAQRQTPTAS